ncbi:MAG: DNA-directed RNA polymerase subunit alpha [Patescibacteria group bacterium]|jgi:DNA-directed RNA polymerase subunit alpha
MQKVILPKKVTFIKGENDFAGQVIIEPCCPGYGTTLGNSLRRVLLSSLKGAAVTGVKINGADHEFTTLPDVKEDILEIILNLKGLRMKFFGEEGEIVKLELRANGENKVTGKDIAKNSKVEIISQDMHIAEITDKKGKLEMDIYVAGGYGYSSIEGRETAEKEVGYIEVDSIFSPIKAIKIDIENVRVGQMTDWERLIIDIKTDGSIEYANALKQAAEILVEQFSFVLDETKKEVGENQVESKKSKAKSKTTDDDNDKGAEADVEASGLETEETIDEEKNKKKKEKKDKSEE